MQSGCAEKDIVTLEFVDAKVLNGNAPVEYVNKETFHGNLTACPCFTVLFNHVFRDWRNGEKDCYQ